MHLHGQAVAVTGGGIEISLNLTEPETQKPFCSHGHVRSIMSQPIAHLNQRNISDIWYKYVINEIGPSHVQCSQQKQAGHWKQSWIRLRLHRSKCELLGCNPAEIPRYFERFPHSKHVES